MILVGLPAAGKSTFYRAFFSGTHHHVSKDLWPNTRKPEARLRRELDEALAAGRSVVVDNVNATTAERAPQMAIARGRGARVIGYYFAVTTRQAVARNAERSGRAKVPNVAIFAAAKRLEVPRLHEGFDQLFRVDLTGDRGYAVRELDAELSFPEGSPW